MLRVCCFSLLEKRYGFTIQTTFISEATGMCDAPFVKIRYGNAAKVKTMGPNWTGNIAVSLRVAPR